jgi:aspartate racemase
VNRTVGILGGKGPEATSELFRLIIANTPVAVEEDHLRVIIDNNPQIPKPALGITGEGEDPTPALVETAQNLERSGAGFIVIPCNSAHHFIDAIRRGVRIPVVDIIEETVTAVHSSGCGCVLLLATSGLIKSGLYQQALTKAGIEVLLPDDDEQEDLWLGTLLFKDKNESAPLRATVGRIVRRLADQSAGGVLLGCTDIPPALRGMDITLPVFNTLEILAKAAIREATQARAQRSNTTHLPLGTETEC